MKKALIVCAISLEFVEIRRFLTDMEEIVHPEGSVYERGIFQSNDKNWEVLLVESGMGNVDAALATQRALTYFEPDALLFVGIAGGLKDVAKGDVIAAPSVFGYEKGKEGDEFQSRPQVACGSFALAERARAEARRSDQRWLRRIDRLDPAPKVLVGPIVAGEKVIASERSPIYERIIKGFSDCLAVEMEGLGFYETVRICGTSSVHALIVRGISDLLRDKSSSDEQGYQVVAAKNAAAFAFEVLANFDPVGASQGTITSPVLSASQVPLSSVSKRLDDIRSELLMRETAFSETLFKAYALAKNILGPDELSWMRSELDGYTTDQISDSNNQPLASFPVYRFPKGDLIGDHSIRGRQPIFFQDPKMQDKFCKRPIAMSIGQIEATLKAHPEAVEMSLASDAEYLLKKALVESWARTVGNDLAQKELSFFRPVLVLSRAAFIGIIDAGRTRLLDLIDQAILAEAKHTEEPAPSSRK